MNTLSRRTLLCGTAGLFGFTAGCLDTADVDSSDGDSGEGNSDSGAGGDEGTNPADGTASVDDTVPFSHATVPTEPDAALLVSADRAERWLAEREFDDETPSEFVDGIDFEESALLALEADAPRLDYELALETISVEHEDGEPQLVVAAAVREASPDSNDVGGTQMIAVGQLVRATFDGDPVTSAAVTIVDSDGREHSLER